MKVRMIVVRAAARGMAVALVALGGTPAVSVAAAAVGAVAAAASADPCTAPASTACYFSFTPDGMNGKVNFYASLTPTAVGNASPTRAVIAIHGHPRDANRTFDATLRAVQAEGAVVDTLVVSPVFQVGAAQAAGCTTPAVPPAAADDLLWTCGSWIEGGPSLPSPGGLGNAGNPRNTDDSDKAGSPSLGSFAALDALVRELTHRWPSLRRITIAGFSAGAQMVQHAIGFAAAPPASVSIRYVVADPGTWLYFDSFRPAPPAAPASCPGINRWKYGTDSLPATLVRSAAEARAAYAAADIHYLEGELDSSADRGTYDKILDKSCSAMAQGPYRLQRGQAYVAYDRSMLAPAKARTLTVVPGCAHDVACVFPSPEGRAVLLGR